MSTCQRALAEAAAGGRSIEEKEKGRVWNRRLRPAP